MATRQQQLILGVSPGKQSAIGVAATTFYRFKKLNTNITNLNFVNETDAAEVGKSHEFATATYPSHILVANSMEKYGSSEFCAWVTGFALGNVTSGTGTYTIIPIDPGTTLELPYFTVVEQVAEGAGYAVANQYIGCSMNDFTYSYASGPGRASSKMSCNWVGSGKFVSPFTTAVPALVAEHHMPAATAALTIQTTDYVTTGRLISGSISWNNNLLLNAGYFPGSGTQSGYQIRGRQEIGARTAGFEFTIRALASQAEVALLTAQTAGAAVFSVTYDASNSISFSLPKVFYKAVEVGDSDGLVTLKITGEVAMHDSTGIMNITAKTPMTGICQ